MVEAAQLAGYEAQNIHGYQGDPGTFDWPTYQNEILAHLPQMEPEKILSGIASAVATLNQMVQAQLTTKTKPIVPKAAAKHARALLQTINNAHEQLLKRGERPFPDALEVFKVTCTKAIDAEKTHFKNALSLGTCFANFLKMIGSGVVYVFTAGYKSNFFPKTVGTDHAGLTQAAQATRDAFEPPKPSQN
jgi:hypothetical protein